MLHVAVCLQRKNRENRKKKTPKKANGSLKQRSLQPNHLDQVPILQVRLPNLHIVPHPVPVDT